MTEQEYGLRDDLTGEVWGGFVSEAEVWIFLVDAPVNPKDATIVRRDKQWTSWYEAFA